MAKFREENTRRTKESIIKTAAKLFAKHSYSDVGLRKVAKEANSTLNTVTYHFGSKKQLFDETMEYTFGEDDRFSELVTKLEGIESLPVDKIPELFHQIIHYAIFTLVGKSVQRLKSSLVDRLLVDENPEIFSLIIKSYSSLTGNFLRILTNSGVEIEYADYRLWVLSVWSEVQFLSYGKRFVLEEFGVKRYNDEILNIFVERIVKKNLSVLYGAGEKEATAVDV